MSSLPPYFTFRFNFKANHFPENVLELSPEFLGPEYEIPFYQRDASAMGLKNRTERQLSNARRVSSPPKKEEEPGIPEFHFRMAWQEKGILLTAILRGKKRPILCDPTRTETSDGLRLLLDMRDVRDIHRASKFCHRFLFLPTEGTSSTAEPVSFWFPIHRAKAHPNPVDVSRFLLASDILEDGWRLSVMIPGNTLTGYEPQEHSRLGFWFSLFDNEFGWFNLQHTGIFPVEEDPSLWSPLDLVE